MPFARNQSPSLLWLIAMVANPPETCAIFPGSIHPSGYGFVSYNGKMRSAHRLAYELAFVPVPDGLLVLHGKNGRRCASRACCNPTHLYAGTAQQNMDDRDRDGTTASGDRHWTRVQPDHPKRAALGEWVKSHPDADYRLRGEAHWAHQKPELVTKGMAHGKAKLTDEQVLEIRRRREAGETGVAVAAAFGVSKALVSLIFNRKNWSHLP